MYLRCLKDVTKKTSFLRCIWDVLKTSQKRRLFWDVSERCLGCLSQWRSVWDISKTFHADWGLFLSKSVELFTYAHALHTKTMAARWYKKYFYILSLSQTKRSNSYSICFPYQFNSFILETDIFLIRYETLRFKSSWKIDLLHKYHGRF